VCREVWKKSGAWFFKGMPKSEDREDEEVVAVNHRRDRYVEIPNKFTHSTGFLPITSLLTMGSICISPDVTAMGVVFSI
jgi:hypothetical protein